MTKLSNVIFERDAWGNLTLAARGPAAWVYGKRAALIVRRTA